MISGTVLLLFYTCAAADVPALPTPEAARAAVVRALEGAAALQHHGGWPREQTLDNRVRSGEHGPIPADWITVQPPATPTVAQTFLRAAQVLDEPRWAEVAFTARDALEQLMSAEGGLPHEADPARGPAKRATLDDDTTTATLRFFLACWAYTGDEPDLNRAKRVGEFLLTAQYDDCGGWPQCYPPPHGQYQACITLNDGVTARAMTELLRLWRVTGDTRYRAGALRAADCLLRLQGGAGEAIWAQQYDPETLAPAWARKFEPPGYTPAESRGVIDVLWGVYLITGDARYRDSIERALEWYATHRGEDGLYARLYEPGTGRPIYGGSREERRVVYDVAEATPGYSWRSDWSPDPAVYQTRDRAADAERWLAQLWPIQAPRAHTHPEHIADVLEGQGAAGLWLRPPQADELKGYAEAGVDPAVPLADFSVWSAQVRDLLGYLEETHGQHAEN